MIVQIVTWLFLQTWTTRDLGVALEFYRGTDLDEQESNFGVGLTVLIVPPLPTASPQW
jgi:hypothetical protein